MKPWTYTHPVLGDKLSISAEAASEPGQEGTVQIEIVDDPDARIVWPTRIKVPVSAIPEVVAALLGAATQAIETA